MKKKNYLREVIQQYGLMEYIEKIPLKERDREIVKKYAAGSNYAALAKEYECTSNNIHRIVYQYIVLVGRHTNKPFLWEMAIKPAEQKQGCKNIKIKYSQNYRL